MPHENLKARFWDYKQDIERSILIKDYEGAIRLIENALPLCEQLYNEDYNMRDVMRQNALTLKRMYAECKRKLGDEVAIVNTSTSTKPKTTSIPSTKTAGIKTSKNSDKNSDVNKNENGEINYVINGVNVKDFITEEANDPVTFDDVKGMDSEKAIIKNEFFRSEKAAAFDKHIGRENNTFILLYGVPGTGKTFFAKAISNELKKHSKTDVPFFSVVGAQLSDCKVGATEKNIQAMFEFCKQFERCVLFIDEFETIVPDRSKATGDPTAASRVTVFLQMLDGFASSKGTLLIAATNRPYDLDSGIISRRSRGIEIPLPDYDVIYGTLLAKIGDNIAEDVDLVDLAHRLDGYSNRDVKKFIGVLRDMLGAEYRYYEEVGDVREFDEFKYTNQMIESAFELCGPTTRPEDLERIKQFKIAFESRA